MVKVSVFYLNEEGKKFDMDYYLNNHLPMIQEKLGAALKGGAVEQGLSGEEPDSPPTYIVIGQMLFDSMEAFQNAWEPHAQKILADVPNYTDIQPVFQISEVKV